MGGVHPEITFFQCSSMYALARVFLSSALLTKEGNVLQFHYHQQEHSFHFQSQCSLKRKIKGHLWVDAIMINGGRDTLESLNMRISLGNPKVCSFELRVYNCAILNYRSALENERMYIYAPSKSEPNVRTFLILWRSCDEHT